ncbi:hypothetical protein PMAYCL1PPCAC_28855 [Pristionchus mayeri]|uniref:CHK kinase-like domain-containing protein n=1 Tax=Pristionchus mayeri TaxID=1317129 RepID=A0AAN5DAM4_9BILA|nr:hypothetical protein PMAYCL1PPCAC_28855 [Pristionchus mayeri]
MSIRTASEGILKTHVTWEELEENLTKALKTTARFGKNKNAIDIGEGNGFASRCALVDCDWEGEAAEKLPKRVVLKMGSCLALMQLSDMLPEEQNMFKDATEDLWAMAEMSIKSVHNIECDTYDFMEQFGEGHTIPKRYYAKRFDEENVARGQICMEYVEGSRMMNFHEKASINLMKQIFQSASLGIISSTQDEVVSESLKTKDVFGEFTRSTPKELLLRFSLPVFIIKFVQLQAVEKMEALLGEYYGANLPSTIHKQLGLAPVLVNGDMRTENILIDRETSDLRALIDWQCTHLGVGVEDLLRISFFAQTTEERRASADLLIEEMYNSFVENLGDTPVPYTLKQLKEVYALLFPHCALFFATGLGVLMPSNIPRAEDSDEKKERWEVVVDKARGVLEDIVTYHEKNKSSTLAVSWNYPAA